MAITRTHKSLADQKIEGHKSGLTPKVATKKTNSKKSKKLSLIGSVWSEIRKVEWPTFGSTASWAGVVFTFTLAMALGVGLLDHVFKQSINYVQCSAEVTVAERKGDKAQFDREGCKNNFIDGFKIK
jgi:preprotein translocase SecE subunit